MKKKLSARKRERDFITWSKTNLQRIHLVGGWTNPSEKYDRQIGNLPQIGMKIKKYLKPPPSDPIPWNTENWLSSLEVHGAVFEASSWW